MQIEVTASLYNGCLPLKIRLIPSHEMCSSPKHSATFDYERRCTTGKGASHIRKALRTIKKTSEPRTLQTSIAATAGTPAVSRRTTPGHRSETSSESETPEHLTEQQMEVLCTEQQCTCCEPNLTGSSPDIARSDGTVTCPCLENTMNSCGH
jgi:hypothetical protein